MSHELETTGVDTGRRALLQGLLGLTALVATGCTRYTLRDPTTIGTQTELRAGVRVATFANDDARNDGSTYPHEVHTELWLLGEDGRRELVHRSRHPDWTRDDLVPGRYELRVVEVSDGKEARTAAGKQKRRFTVAAGDRAEVALTLKSFPWEAVVVVLIAVVIVVGVILLVAAVAGGGGKGGGGSIPLGSGGGPKGGGPPPLGVDPGVLHVAAVLLDPLTPLRILALPCDVYFIGPPWPIEYADDVPPPPPEPAAPGIAAIRPPRTATEAAELTFTKPMKLGDLGPDTLQIVGPDGMEAVGVSFSPDGFLAWVRPLRPLTPGHWRVRALGRAIHDEDGRALGYDAQVGFDIA